MFLLVSELLEPGVLDSLASRYSVIRVVNQKLLDQIYRLWANVLDQLGDACSIRHIWKVEFHVSSVLLELI